MITAFIFMFHLPMHLVLRFEMRRVKAGFCLLILDKKLKVFGTDNHTQALVVSKA